MPHKKYEKKKNDILKMAEAYHDNFYKLKVFNGPSLFFHERSLACRNNAGFKRHLEYVYATLASWGMHRMGQRGAKMKSFEDFQRSIGSLKRQIKDAQKINPLSICPKDWQILEDIFRGIKIMSSGTSLIGNSKVMAHLIPDIIPPIDRSYTLKYLKGKTEIRNNLNEEWELMKDIVENFFIPVANDECFRAKADEWIPKRECYPWDTSAPKLIDNLIIGAVKMPS